MRRRGVVFLGATAVAAAVLFFVFHDKLDSASRHDGKPAVPEYYDPAKTISTSPDREFMVVLTADPSALRWQLDPALDKSLLQVLEIRHRATKTKQGERQVKDLWTFKGIREGETTILFAATGAVSGEEGQEKKMFTVVIKK